MNVWNRPFPPATASEVRDLEHAISAPLPSAYRDFLLVKNGGYPENDMVFRLPSVKEDLGTIMLGSLYGIGGQAKGLDLETQHRETKGITPAGYIPIGEDPGGNSLLLEISGGQVVFWDRIGFLANKYRQDLFPVAEGIDQFLSSLQEYSGPA